MPNKEFRFAELITIHEFPIILGDNPSCSSGAPIQIGWKAYQTTTRNLELFEFIRWDERRSDRKHLIIPVEQRGQLLLRSGYTIDQIANATVKADEIKEQRQGTLRKQGWDRMAMVLETTGKIPKGIMRGVLGTTGDIISTTGDIAKTLVNTGGKVVSATVDGLASTGRRMSKTFSKPETIQARSA